MRPILLLALLSHLALSLGYLMLTPAFEGPDETDHFGYAAHLAQARELPLCRGSAAVLGRSPLDEAGLAHHPPLYYALLAVTMHGLDRADTVHSSLANEAFAPPVRVLNFRHGGDERPPRSRGIRLLWALRGWSVLLGAVSVWLVHVLGRRVCPDRPAVADTAALLVGCLPMWSFLHGVLNSDNLATVLCQASLIALFDTATRAVVRVRDGVSVGVLLGLAFLSKITTLFLGVLWLVVVVRLLLRPEGGKRTGLQFALLSGLTALLLSGWVFLRNALLYGDPLALAAHHHAFAAAAVPPGAVWEWLRDGFAPNILSSLVGRFGWFALPLAKPWTLAWGGVAVLGITGLSWSVARGRGPRGLWLCATAVLLVFGLTLWFNLAHRQPQGRLLFPAIGPLAVLLASGLCSLVRPARAFGWLAFLLPVGGFWVLSREVKPAFAIAHATAPVDHASMATWVTRRPAAPRIRAVVERGERPLLRWREAGAPRDARYSVYLFDERGRVYGATWEWVRLPLRRELRLPAEWWGLLPTDRRVFAKVRRVPLWGEGQRDVDMPESEVVELLR
ncbi:MAG: glycosyltransferase family 39 protein [Planctomycetes bacterium]|nr:glycosyltransferase family 39 protein [Planctomycetota bacterium]